MAFFELSSRAKARNGQCLQRFNLYYLNGDSCKLVFGIHRPRIEQFGNLLRKDAGKKIPYPPGYSSFDFAKSLSECFAAM